MKANQLIFSLLFFSIIFTSCSDDDNVIEEEVINYSNGIIISSEGNWGDKDGSISYVSDDLSSLATNFIYTGENGVQLGSLIQSIAFDEENAYIVLDDAQSVVVVDKYTFKQKATITGFVNPRYMAIIGDKGYVTNWGATTFTDNDDYLAVIDLTTNTLEAETISLSYGVEQIIASDDKLYVTHKGAWSSNNIVSVVDVNNGNAVTEIEVNDTPDDIVFDDAGNLIVLCEGNTIYNADWSVAGITTAGISFIDTTSNSVTKSIEFAENDNATYLDYDNGSVYYYQSSASKVFEVEETATAIATEGIEVGSIYGMSVRNSELFTVSYAFTSLSQLKVYDINTEEEIYSSAVGLGASKIYFN